MQQKHLFIMDPVEKLNLARDSSLRMAFALSRRGESIYFCEIQNLYWESGSVSSCYAKALKFSKNAETFKMEEEEAIPLDTFRSIHMRKDPPFDIPYFTATWFLDGCPKALVVNRPEALRRFNEKMGILQFPEDSKKSLVSSNPKHLLNFIEKECNGDAVLKPLHLYGGKGITHISLKSLSKPQIDSILKNDTENGSIPRLAQAFDPKVFDGEVRVFLVGGKAISWCLKIPKEGDFLANTASGATLQPYVPSMELCLRMEKVAKELLTQGIYFVGMDLINEQISEINITSPRLLTAPGDTHDYYSEIADWILSYQGE